MKNIVKTIILCVIAASFMTGCIKETFPLEGSATSEQVAQSSVALKASVDGIVAQTYQPYFFFGSSRQLEFDISYAGLLITYARMTCDMVNNSATIGYDWWTGYTGAYGYVMNYENSRSTVPFMSLYKVIKSANDIIGPLCQKDFAEINNETKGYLGSAYVYRALMYHDLYNIYLPAQNKYTDCSNVEGLTVPIVLSSSEPETEYKTARAPKEAVSALVISDLDKAEQLFANYIPTNNLYPSIAVVYGIKARMYLSIEDYNNAAIYARKAIDASGKTPLTKEQWLDPTKAFCDASGNNSWMWYYSISANNMGNLCNPTGFLAGESDWGYNSITKLSINRWLYDRLNRTDFRKQSFIDPDRTTYNADYYKWGNKSGFLKAYPFNELPDYMSFKIRCKQGDWETYSIGGAIEFPIMRVEEMYLIEAEAVGMRDGEAAGSALLETFMTTYRDPGYSYTAAQSSFTQGFVKNFQEEVLYQKRIEFWGEGIGYFDAKRIRPGIKTWYAGANTIHATQKYVIDEVSPYWNLCIPIDEIENNDYIIKADEVSTEINGVKTTPNNPDPTNSVSNETTTYLK
ncbi:MAG: RagB/SusD family nutrient uptake outer membrane protein [Bacteroidales bacterium]|nr:RagB/SusD family nutrient uptake outer membrane protein [Bacteroidales bacterium]MDD4670299.1 RagB/SusD family nutrient uptake outer membrane protein [Bacteroidales bacterium]